MKTSQPFGYPVNDAGLPRDWCTIDPTENENITNLKAYDIAKTYWLLESLSVNYAYSINGIRRERNLLLQSNVEPIYRIEQNPRFYHISTDSNNINTLVELDLSSTSHSSTKEGLFNLTFRIEERDDEQLFTLTCSDVFSQRLITSHNFTFMNRNLTLKLWTVSTKWTGSIEYFTVTPEYYTII